MANKSKIKNEVEFDYEKKVWGGGEVKISPFFIQGLKLKYTIQALKNVKGKVLDIGCGAGNMARAVKRYRNDLDVYGVDISKYAIKEAENTDKNVKYKVASCENLPFGNHTFDALLMYDVLEHLENPQQTVNEMKRVLKPNGIIHVFSPLDGQPWTFYRLIYKLGWQPKNVHTGHLQVFSADSFEKLFIRNKFITLDKKYSFHYFFSIFDITYFSLLELIKFNPPSSIEGMIENKKKNIFMKIFNLLYRLVVAIGYYESILLSKLPGGGGHFTYKKL